MKSTFKYQVLEEITVMPTVVDEGVVWDKRIQLNSSKEI